MGLEPYQMFTNAPVAIGGNDGRIVTSDASLTSVVRDDGSVDWYDTGWISENAEVPQPPSEATTSNQVSGPAQAPPVTPVTNATGDTNQPTTQTASDQTAAATDQNAPQPAQTAPTEQTAAPAPAADPAADGSRQQTA